MMVVALKGNVIMPFEGTRFAGTKLSTLGQLETLPKECQKRFMMELEDQNGLLAVWLEAVSGKAHPKGWGSERLPVWEEVVGHWKGVETRAAIARRKAREAEEIKAEQEWKAEEQRKEEEAEKSRRAEEARKKAEAKRAEDERRAEEERKAEAQRAEEQRKADEEKARKAKEAQGNMVLVKGGTFKMGDTYEDGDDVRMPVHEINLSDFFLDKYEVTVEDFHLFIKATNYRSEAEYGAGALVLISNKLERRSDANWKNPYFVQSINHPVICVSWNDAIAYCNWRSENEGLIPAYSGSGDSITCDWGSNGYRLPTEAEWEYAAGGGRSSKGSQYSRSDEVGKVAWYGANSEGMTHPVGEKSMNELGLYDMSGNVREWCWDLFGDYSAGRQDDPRGAVFGPSRVDRGGCWYYSEQDVRIASRDCDVPSCGRNGIGFRLARSSTC